MVTWIGSELSIELAGRRKVYAGVVCGAGAGALWGFAVLAPELVHAFSPIMIAVGRYLVYGAASAMLIAPRWSKVSPMLARSDWLMLLWLALLGNTVFYILVAVAVHTGGVATTSLILGFLPVIVASVGSRQHGAVSLRRLAPSLILGARAAACISWQTLAAPASANFGKQLVGFIAAIGAVTSWSSYAIINARCLLRLPSVTSHEWNLMTGVMTGLQAVVLVPIALLTDAGGHSPATWLTLVVVSVGVALVASMAGNALWNRMSRLLPLTMIGQMFLFETLFAILYGLVWEERLPHPLEVAALALVTGSVLCSVTAHRSHMTATTSV